MAKMQANQMRAGMVIEFEGQRYTILKQNIMIPGKGAAVIQVEMRNVKTGAKKDQRWRTADTVERLTTEDKEFTYSYEDGGNLILMDPETVERCDVLICESTYANRQHPDTANVSDELQRIICRAAELGGRVIIPAFSLGRTQMLAFLLNELRNRSQLCRVPVFIDSPLATRLTDVHRQHTDDMDSDVQNSLRHDDDVFSFPGLTYVRTQDESMALNRTPGPLVIIAAGGMCENGRIVHHLKHSLDDERNTVMIIGFQAEHTLGRRLVERRPEVSIFGRRIPVRARVEVVNGLSAHADADDFRWWFGELQKRGGTGETYIVHGELNAAQALADIATDCSDELPVIPKYGQSFVIQ
ncbi:MAG: MBL fold metallo-hydrolase RNA specificity domain-containing protein [Planctomycetaceae bacterium]